MRALVFEEFGGPLVVRDVPTPGPSPRGVVVKVEATGICRSDWHGWMGHDPGIALPHVPGHELAGTVSALGSAVSAWSVGDRVTVPFVNACGRCAQCLEGEHQVCRSQRQPGFTHWGSMAEYVAVDEADVNLVHLPDQLPFITAAALGCRFATAYRAVLQVGRAAAGEWVVVHGCGGVGLSAVQIAAAAGAQVIAVDPSSDATALALELGASHAVSGPDVASQVHNVTGSGAHLSIDAFGSEQTVLSSIACLRPRGRHVQVGLLVGAPFALPLDQVLADELEILGSHGMAAHAYPEMLGLIAKGKLDPARLVTRELRLDQAAEALVTVGATPGIAVVSAFA